MNHKLLLRDFGPIEYCEFELNKFTVLTGPQANGKSTIAKAIYFSRTLKQDIWDIMISGGPSLYSNIRNATWEKTLRKKLKDKFMNIFGSSWIMPDDMELCYSFGEKVSVTVKKSQENAYLDILFGESLQEYLADLDHHVFFSMGEGQKKSERERLETLLNDDTETVFIPAGRNMITLLSEQLGYLFASMDSPQLRNIDYLTRQYVATVLKLRPSFSDGMDGYWKNHCSIAGGKNQNRGTVHELIKRTNELLNGKYRCVDGEDRLYLNQVEYLKIKFSSSGQQEIVWILNLLFYYLAEEERVFLILEEPESHLYPEAQQQIGEILSLFYNNRNEMLITTHSPYLLATFNYMLQAGQCREKAAEMVKSRLHKRCWLKPDEVSAYHVQDGEIRDSIDREDELVLITDEVIDGASLSINEIGDFIMEQNWKAQAVDD